MPKADAPCPKPSTTTMVAGLVTAHTGIRGLLALWIVIFHCLLRSLDWSLHGSALLPLFFLLSGYSLAITYGKTDYKDQSLDDDKEQRKQRTTFGFRSFYQNRFARIAPVYYVATLMALPLAIFGHGWAQPDDIGWAVATNVLAVHMWDGWPEPMLAGPGWTISTLVFFYLVFPWLLKRHQGRTDRSLNRWIIALAVVQAIVYFGLSSVVYTSTLDVTRMFWAAHAWPLSRVFVFEMGLVAGLLVLRQGRPDRDTAIRVMGVSSDQGNQWGRRVDWGAGVFIVCIAVLSITHIVTRIDLGGSWWMQGAFPFMLLQVIVGLSMTGPGGTSVTVRLLNWPPLLYLGKISMALYLVHEPIIQYVAWIARPDQSWIEALPTPMPVWGTAVVIPVSLVLAVFLERYVETPARNFLRSKPHRT